jgi:hypothetical protein
MRNISGPEATPACIPVSVAWMEIVSILVSNAIAIRRHRYSYPIMVSTIPWIEFDFLENSPCTRDRNFLFQNSGVITDKEFLPITRLNFGRTQLETSSGVHTLGRFECTGQVAVNGMPKSCEDLWKIGHTLSGLYSVMGSQMIESLYCDFNKLPGDSGKHL